MPNYKLSDREKERVAVLFYHHDQTQVSLAARFGVSRRTIQRALIEKGVLAPRSRITARDLKCLEVLDSYRITPAHLRKVLERDQNRRICCG